jgi:hypothetical protein
LHHSGRVTPLLTEWHGQRRFSGPTPSGSGCPLRSLLLKAMPNLNRLGEYDPDRRTGPAIWVRCVVDRTLDEPRVLEGHVPIVLLISFSWLELRAQQYRKTRAKPCIVRLRGEKRHINDGVRLNIWPFMLATSRKGGKKGAGILRAKPNAKWSKDCGKEPESLRPKADFPWLWNCAPEKKPEHRKELEGGAEV